MSESPFLRILRQHEQATIEKTPEETPSGHDAEMTSGSTVAEDNSGKDKFADPDNPVEMLPTPADDTSPGVEQAEEREIIADNDHTIQSSPPKGRQWKRKAAIVLAGFIGFTATYLALTRKSVETATPAKPVAEIQIKDLKVDQTQPGREPGAEKTGPPPSTSEIRSNREITESPVNPHPDPAQTAASTSPPASPEVDWNDARRVNPMTAPNSLEDLGLRTFRPSNGPRQDVQSRTTQTASCETHPDTDGCYQANIIRQGAILCQDGPRPLALEFASSAVRLRKGLGGRRHMAPSTGFVTILPQSAKVNYLAAQISFPIDIMSFRRDGALIDLIEGIAPHRQIPIGLNMADGVIALAGGEIKRLRITRQCSFAAYDDGVPPPVAPTR